MSQKFISTQQRRKGFTLVELVVVLGVATTLMAFTTLNLFGLQRHTHIQTTISTFVADIYEQRQRAMIGDTQGRTTTDAYGIYLQSSQYTLFHGTSYSASASGNVVIPFENPITMSSTTFPNSAIVFSKGSGEISEYSSTQNAVTLTNSSSNEQVTITFNQYGAITSNLP